MSVRRETHRDPATGAVREYWVVDVMYRFPSGKKKRIRRVPQVGSRREAEAFERRMLAELALGTFGRKEEEKPTPTFEEFVPLFLDNYAETNNKPSEVEAKRMILNRHLVPFFGRKRLDEIEDFEVERYKARKVRGEELSPKSVNNHLTVLHKLLHTAAQWKRVDRAKLPTIVWLKAPRPKFDFLDFDEAPRLLAAAKSEPEWHAMILLGLRTGLRQGELLALRWEDVDLVAGRLMVRQAVARGKIGTPKSGREREVPLSNETVATLKAIRHLRGPYVFCDRAGKLLKKGECKHPLWRSCKRAGLRRIGWHVLRHTFASHLVMRGIPLKTVQEFLGHATIEMTMRYAHLSPDARREAVQVLDGSHARAVPAGPELVLN